MSTIKKIKNFSPLSFLASLGAGGIAIIPFAFLQYTFPHGPELVKIADLKHGTLSAGMEFFFRSLEGVMVIFSIIHLILTIVFIKKFLRWRKTESYKEMFESPLSNAALVTPLLSIAMTMNVFIGPIRFFIPSFADNLQGFMFPALVFWIVLWTVLMATEIKLLKISFVKGFDISKITFGWLLHPFALGMVTVVGTGIAAMSRNPSIANLAAFMALISGSMGIFLLLVKLFVIFKSQFGSDGLPEKQFLPSFLIVVPVMTLYSISAFRIGHYLEHAFDFHLSVYFFFVIVLPFAFQIWYLLFGVSLLKDYFKKHFFKKEYHVTQWGLVCPVVAFGVLGSFVHKIFLPSPILYGVIILSVVTAVILFLFLLRRMIGCINGKNELNCE